MFFKEHTFRISGIETPFPARERVACLPQAGGWGNFNIQKTEKKKKKQQLNNSE